ncbi:MAG: hypothetical protein U0V48_02950 [Anaerolineales bacterium]
MKFADSIDEKDQMLLFDPQTSGGLLLKRFRKRNWIRSSRARERRIKPHGRSGASKRGQASTSNEALHP